MMDSNLEITHTSANLLSEPYSKVNSSRAVIESFTETRCRNNKFQKLKRIQDSKTMGNERNPEKEEEGEELLKRENGNEIVSASMQYSVEREHEEEDVNVEEDDAEGYKDEPEEETE